jgi:hypothetical protein
MSLNYTPLDIKKLNRREENRLNFYLLLTATIFAAFLAVLLFILIQKKMSSRAPVSLPAGGETNELTPTQTPILTPTPTPTSLPTPTLIMETPPPSTPSPTVITPLTPEETSPAAKIGTESAQ